MNPMKRIYIILSALFLIGTSLLGQAERNEIGFRGGYSFGPMYRINLTEDLSYEAQLVYRNQGAVVTALRQRHEDIGMDRGGNWKFLYGMGIHAGFYFTDHYRVFFQEIYYGRNILTPVVGIDGYVGVDYCLEVIPMSIGVNFQPFMEISLASIFGVNLWDFGMSIRYRF